MSTHQQSDDGRGDSHGLSVGVRSRGGLALLALLAAGALFWSGGALAQSSGDVGNAERLPAKDISLVGGDPKGIWSDGTTMWVVNDGYGDDNKVYAYDLSTGDPDNQKSFTLDHSGGNGTAKGAAGSDGTLWVANEDNRVFGYSIASGSSYGSRDHSAGGALYADDAVDPDTRPTGLWSDGSALWAAHHVTEEISEYPISSSGALGGAQAPVLSHEPPNSKPRGLWSDGTTIWVADSAQDRVFAYRLAGDGFGDRLAAREIKLVDGNSDPWGIWSDGSTMWVGDHKDDKLYAYSLPPAPSGIAENITYDYIRRNGVGVTATFNSGGRKCARLLAAESESDQEHEVERCTSGTRLSLTLGGLRSAREFDLVVDLGTNGQINTGGFKTRSAPDEVHERMKNDLVRPLGQDYPWLVHTYNQIRRTDFPIRVLDLSVSGVVTFSCKVNHHTYVPECPATLMEIDPQWTDNLGTLAHEMGHLWANDRSFSGPSSLYAGIGHLYFGILDDGQCTPQELFADALEDPIPDSQTNYFVKCDTVPDTPSQETRDFIQSLTSDEVPDWFIKRYAATDLAYDTSTDDRYDDMYDLEKVWSDIKAHEARDRTNYYSVHAFDDEFGGYCSALAPYYSLDYWYTQIVNPWKMGGCKPHALVINVTGRDSLEWLTPHHGGATLDKIWVEWTPEGKNNPVYVQAPVNSLSFRHPQLAKAETVHVFATNHFGWGPKSTATMQVNEVLWSSFMTVSVPYAVPGGGYWIPASEYSDSVGGVQVTRGSLTTDTFTVGNTERRIEQITLYNLGDSPVLSLGMGGRLSADFSFYVGNQRFDKSDAFETRRWQYDLYEWDHGGLEWSHGDTVPVRLVVHNAQPTGLPVIAEAPIVGTELAASTSEVEDADGMTGASFSYQWYADDGVDTKKVSGATSSTFTPRNGDVGKRFSVRVTYSDDVGVVHSITSEPTAPVRAQGMVWAAVMTVGGMSNSLSGYEKSSHGTLSSDAFTLDSSEHIVRSISVNHSGQLELVLDGPETATDFALDIKSKLFAKRDAAISSPSADSRSYRWENSGLTWQLDDRIIVGLTPNRPPVGVPSINGAARVGKKLRSSVSQIADPDGLPPADQFSYQWAADGADIEGATSSTYRPALAEDNKQITLRVTYTDDAGFPETATSRPTAPVEPSAYGGVIWAATLSVEQWVYLDDGRFGFAAAANQGALSPDTFSHAGNTYTVDNLFYFQGGALRLDLQNGNDLGSGDFHLYIEDTRYPITAPGADTRFEFTDHNTNWNQGDQIEIRLAANRDPSGKPVFDGVARVGDLLTSGTADIEDPDGINRHRSPRTEFTYQWTADDTVIEGATLNTYSITNTDENKQIQLQVTYTDNAGFQQTVTSRTTSPVLPPLRTDTEPPIVGVAYCIPNWCSLLFNRHILIDAQHAPPLTAFTLTADGNPITIEGIVEPTPVGTARLFVDLAIADGAIETGQTLTITYTDPTQNDDTAALQDIFGNDVATFTTTMINSSEFADNLAGEFGGTLIGGL